MALGPGATASFSRTVTEHDVYAMAEIIGDYNPIHTDPAAAAQSPFGERIAHALLPAGYISTVLGMILPGPGTVYLHQSLDFKAPVKIGDTITAAVTVTEILNPAKGIYKLRTACHNQHGELVADGEAVVKYAP